MRCIAQDANLKHIVSKDLPVGARHVSTCFLFFNEHEFVHLAVSPENLWGNCVHTNIYRQHYHMTASNQFSIMWVFGVIQRDLLLAFLDRC